MMKTKLGKWQTKEQLLDLLTSLVKIPSITDSPQEVIMAKQIYNELQSLPYFLENKDYLQLHPTNDNRYFLTALVKRKHTKNTIILISHFDVVDVKEYGEWKNSAFDPVVLTETFYQKKDILPVEVRNDIESGNWLFGRGTMDMKAGLALHMSMIERACAKDFDGNIMLLTVCDEEGNSTGMRSAVPILLELAKKHDLEYKACVNSEPVFSQYPGDQNNYMYTGSIGKLNPGFLCYGKETHVGEPFSGINANLMASEVTKEMELNPIFCEIVDGEITPPPTNLIQKGLKSEYSVQIPYNAVTLFNMFLMEKSVEDVIIQLRKSAERAASRIEEHLLERGRAYSKPDMTLPTNTSIDVVFYEELLEYAEARNGKDTVQEKISIVLSNKENKDSRQLTIELIDELAHLCKERWPMIVPFFAPPFYPAVNSSGVPLIDEIVEETRHYAKKNYNVDIKKINYFSGISDLSYTNLQHPASSFQSLISNMPLWGSEYFIPFDELERLNVPSLNISPIGKDAHKWTERLDVDYTFDTLRDILYNSIQKLLK